jgi:hypothetical protein
MNAVPGKMKGNGNRSLRALSQSAFATDENYDSKNQTIDVKTKYGSFARQIQAN